MKGKNLITIKKNQRGQAALLIVLTTMFLLLFVSLALTNMTAKQTRITNNTLQSVQAYYLADAGAERLLYLIKGTGAIDPVLFPVGDELLNEDIDFDNDGSADGSFKAIKTNNSPLGMKITGYSKFKNAARAVELSW